MNSPLQDTAHRSGKSVRALNPSLRTYIYYSTLVGVFSAVLMIRVPFAIRLFDVIMLTNLLLMFLLINLERVAPWVLWLMLYLALSGGIGIVNGTDSISLVAKELLGISVSLLYFYSFFKLIHNDFERAFLTYAKFAYWFAIIALPLWAVSCFEVHGYERLQGLTSEPTAFCQLVLPAFYWYASQYLTSRKHGVEVAIFTLAIVLSGSSNGYLCVAFGAILLLSGRRKNLLAVPIVLGGLLGLIYAVSPDFRMRIDDTLLAATTEDVSGANLSTYALISNMIVTQQVLKESPLIGNGLGSHPLSHEKFMGDVPGIQSFVDMGTSDLNAADAASLTLRVLSELGLLGYIGVLAFLIYFHVSGSGPRSAISNAILVHFFLKLLRGGQYFDPEQFFFIFVYIFNHRQFKHEARTVDRLDSLRPSTAGLKLVED